MIMQYHLLADSDIFLEAVLLDDFFLSFSWQSTEVSCRCSKDCIAECLTATSSLWDCIGKMILRVTQVKLMNTVSVDHTNNEDVAFRILTHLARTSIKYLNRHASREHSLGQTRWGTSSRPKGSVSGSSRTSLSEKLAFGPKFSEDRPCV